MARFTGSSGGGSGAPGPQGPAGPAGADAVLPQDLGTTDSPVFSKITLTSNGATDNITIGDDVILGDGNVANHVVIIGQQDATAGGIVLGTNETEVISTNGTDLSVTANNDIVLLPGSNYAYLNVVDPDHRLATMADIAGGGGGADLGDFQFTAGTATVNDNETLLIQANNADTVKSQLVLDPNNGIAKLQAFDNPNVVGFYASNPDWDSATWAIEPGVGSVINFVNAPNILNWIGTSSLSVYDASMVINGIPAGTVNGFSYNGTDITLFINNTVPTEDPTVNEIGFAFVTSSFIDINYDNGSFDIEANNMDVNIKSDDDIYITAGGDDLFLRANDDIRFVARYNEPGMSDQQWTMNSEGQLHFPGMGYIENVVNGSGDGYGNDTFKIVPDDDLVSGNGSDQYLIIDPTSPNHIHIRAGGTQDESSAYLIIGGERTHVQVSDQDGNVRISSKQPDITYSLQNLNPESSNLLIVEGEFTAIDWNWFVQYNGTKYGLNGYYTQNGQTFITQYDIPFETGGYYNFGYTRGENNWNFSSNGTLYGPAQGYIPVSGLTNDPDFDFTVTSNRAITLSADNGEFLNDPTVPSNQIAKIGDLSEDSGVSLQSVRWTPNFEATGLVFAGSGDTHPTYNSYYVKQGQLVSFWIAIDLSTVTDFGTGQLKTALPFAPLAGSMNHFSGWVNVDEAANPDLAGHIIVNADHLANTSVLDLHYIKQQGGANSPVMEAMLIQGTPVTLTTSTNIYVNGTYIAAS